MASKSSPRHPGRWAQRLMGVRASAHEFLLQRKPAWGARGSHLESGVDEAGDLEGGQGFGEAFETMDAGGIGQREAVLTQEGGLEGEALGVGWGEGLQAVDGPPHCRQGIGIEAVGILGKRVDGEADPCAFGVGADWAVGIQGAGSPKGLARGGSIILGGGGFTEEEP